MTEYDEDLINFQNSMNIEEVSHAFVEVYEIETVVEGNLK